MPRSASQNKNKPIHHTKPNIHTNSSFRLSSWCLCCSQSEEPGEIFFIGFWPYSLLWASAFCLAKFFLLSLVLKCGKQDHSLHCMKFLMASLWRELAEEKICWSRNEAMKFISSHTFYSSIRQIRGLCVEGSASENNRRYGNSVRLKESRDLVSYFHPRNTTIVFGELNAGSVSPSFKLKQHWLFFLLNAL